MHSMVTPKKILLFGGTGPTGLLVLKKALDHGHIVTLYLRNEGKVPQDIKGHANLKVRTSLDTGALLLTILRSSSKANSPMPSSSHRL
jgi:putative NADH-flavin reductase